MTPPVGGDGVPMPWLRRLRRDRGPHAGADLERHSAEIVGRLRTVTEQLEGALHSLNSEIEQRDGAGGDDAGR